MGSIFSDRARRVCRVGHWIPYFRVCNFLALAFRIRAFRHFVLDFSASLCYRRYRVDTVVSIQI